MQQSKVSLTVIAIGFLFIALPQIGNAADIHGHWKGVMVREGSELNVEFDFAAESGGKWKGTYSCDAQRATDIPLSEIRINDQFVHFELKGDETTILFEGKMATDEITGEWKENEIHGTFRITRTSPETGSFKEEEIHFGNGRIKLAGTLLSPISNFPAPGVIFLHGSGGEGRWASRFLAKKFAEKGIASLIFDKRGVGQSEGDWKQADFNDLAGDALAGLRFLQNRKEVDRKHIGFYGHSQGGIIASIAGSQSNDISFIISASSWVGRLSDQDAYHIEMDLKEKYSPQEVEEAMKYYRLYIHVARTGEGWNEFQSATEVAKKKKWFAYYEPPPKEHWSWAFHRKIGDYDTTEAWQKIKVPVLAIYGEKDEVQSSKKAIHNMEKALAKAGNHDFAIYVMPDAAHNMMVVPDTKPFEWPHLARGYTDLLIAWILYQH